MICQKSICTQSTSHVIQDMYHRLLVPHVGKPCRASWRQLNECFISPLTLVRVGEALGVSCLLQAPSGKTVREHGGNQQSPHADDFQPGHARAPYSKGFWKLGHQPIEKESKPAN